MAIEKNTFPFKGLSVEVSAGDEKTQASIKYEEDGINKEYYIDGIKTSKIEKSIEVFYNKLLKDSKGNILNQDIPQSFNAVKQESTNYFYNVPADPLGLKLDQMCVNGLLYELLGAICFSPEDGNFYPPISASYETTKVTYTEEPAEEEPEGGGPYRKFPLRESNHDGSISIFTEDILGTPTYELLEKEEVNETGKFEDLDAGTYHVKVSSDAAEMPLVLTIIVGEEYSIEAPV